MATKLGEMVTCCKKLKLIKSRNLLNTWLREVT